MHTFSGNIDAVVGFLWNEYQLLIRSRGWMVDGQSLFNSSIPYPPKTGDVNTMKKVNGWIIIGLCIAAIAAAVGVIYLIGQLG
jgi:hypothetical protein